VQMPVSVNDHHSLSSKHPWETLTYPLSHDSLIDFANLYVNKLCHVIIISFVDSIKQKELLLKVSLTATHHIFHKADILKAYLISALHSL
jgi:hypothetical protein